MSTKFKTIGMYIFRGFDYLLWAGFFWLITYWYWISFSSLLVVYIWNILGISIALVIDKVRLGRIYKKMDAPVDEKTRSKLAKKNVGSLKASLYLFYIFALIVSQIIAMDAMPGVSDNMRGYFESVEKGILALFAIDNFFGYLVGDSERIKRYKDKFKGRGSDL